MSTVPRQRRSPVVPFLVGILLVVSVIIAAIIVLLPPGGLISVTIVGSTEVSGVVWTSTGQPYLQWQADGVPRSAEELRLCLTPVGGSVEECGAVAADGLFETALLPGMYTVAAQRCISNRCGLATELALGVDEGAEFPEFRTPRIDVRGDAEATVTLEWMDRSVGAPAVAYVASIDAPARCDTAPQAQPRWTGELAPRDAIYRLFLRVIDAAGNCSDPPMEFPFEVTPPPSGLRTPIVRAWADASRTERIQAQEWQAAEQVYVDWIVDHGQDTREHSGYVFGMRAVDGTATPPCRELDVVNERSQSTVLAQPISVEGRMELMVASVSEGGFCEVGTLEVWSDLEPPGTEHVIRAGGRRARRTHGDWHCFDGCAASWPSEASGTVAAVHVGGRSTRGPCGGDDNSERVSGDTLRISQAMADGSVPGHARVSYRVEDAQGRCGARGGFTALVRPLDPEEVVGRLQATAEGRLSERARRIRRSEEHHLHGGGQLDGDDDRFDDLSTRGVDAQLGAALRALAELSERVTQDPERYGLDDGGAERTAEQVQTSVTAWLETSRSVELNAAMDAPIRMADLLQAVRDDTMHRMGDPNTCPIERWPLDGRFGSCPEGRSARSNSSGFASALESAQRRLVY